MVVNLSTIISQKAPSLISVLRRKAPRIYNPSHSLHVEPVQEAVDTLLQTVLFERM